MTGIGTLRKHPCICAESETAPPSYSRSSPRQPDRPPLRKGSWSPRRHRQTQLKPPAVKPAVGSYDIGLMLGSQLQQNGLTPVMSIDAMIRGLKEALGGRNVSAQERDAANRTDARRARRAQREEPGRRAASFSNVTPSNWRGIHARPVSNTRCSTGAIRRPEIPGARRSGYRALSGELR